MWSSWKGEESSNWTETSSPPDNGSVALTTSIGRDRFFIWYVTVQSGDQAFEVCTREALTCS